MYRQQIWLDKGNIIIQAHLDTSNLVIDTVINSPFYYVTKSFFKNYSQVQQSHDTAQINNFLLNAYKENLSNPFSFLIGNNYLLINQNSKLNLIKLKRLFEHQGDNFKWFLFYPIVVDRTNNILTTEKINFPSFNFYDKKYKKIKLNLIGADYYVFDFWFLHCAPCIQQHKEIKSKLNELKAKNVDVIGISTDDTSDYNAWVDYLAKHNYNWQNYLQDNKNSLTKHLSIGSFPTYVVVDNEGKIIGTYNRFVDVLNMFMVDE